MIIPQYGYPSYYPQMQNMYTAQQQPVQQQIRSGGIVSVANEDEARRYPVAPGYTVTMRDEHEPYLYEKTMGFSQLDQPVFRKARIVFEDDDSQDGQKQPPAAPVIYAELTQLEELRDAVSAELTNLRTMIESTNNKRRINDDESKYNAGVYEVRAESSGFLPAERNADSTSKRTAVTSEPYTVHDEFRRHFPTAVQQCRSTGKTAAEQSTVYADDPRIL